MKFKVSNGGVPTGSYVGKFLGVEPYENEYGECMRWEWEITVGDCKGQKASRLTGLTPTLKNACGKMPSAVSGKPLNAGEEIDLTPCVGKPYLLIVQAGEKGGTRVETVTTPPLA